jgi:mRNA interferase MazF
MSKDLNQDISHSVKGDIVLIPFPFTDLSNQKVRPALTLSTQMKSEDIVVSFISSVKPKKLDDFDIKIEPDKTNGLKLPSIIKIDKIATLNKKIILGELGKIDSTTSKMVEQKIKQLFDL